MIDIINELLVILALYLMRYIDSSTNKEDTHVNLTIFNTELT
jgi:hypothetical protein